MIFYFSSTGNSLSTARMIAEALGERLCPIVANRLPSEDYSAEQVIGFVYPTFNSDTPAFIKTFMKQLRISSEAYIFIVCTCGGGQGNTLLNGVKTLRQCGMSVAYTAVVELPDNTAPMLGNGLKMYTIDEQPAAVAKIVDDLKAHKHDTRQARYNIVVPLIAGISWVVERHVLNNLHANPDKCIGCGICAKVCPADNIQIVPREGNKPLAVLGKNCTECLSCLHWCPQTAIQVKKPYSKERQYHHPDIRLKDIVAARTAY